MPAMGSCHGRRPSASARRRRGRRGRCSPWRLAGVGPGPGFPEAAGVAAGLRLDERRGQGLARLGDGARAWGPASHRRCGLADGRGAALLAGAAAARCPASAPRWPAPGSLRGRHREHLAEAELRGGADQLDDFLLANSGNGDDDVVAGLGDLGVGDAAAVDPVTDDVHGEVEALLGGAAPVRRDGLTASPSCRRRGRGHTGRVRLVEEHRPAHGENDAPEAPGAFAPVCSGGWSVGPLVVSLSVIGVWVEPSQDCLVLDPCRRCAPRPRSLTVLPFHRRSRRP